MLSKRVIRVRNRVVRFLQREAYIGNSSYTDRTITDLAKKIGLELDENNQAKPIVENMTDVQMESDSKDLLTLEQRIKNKVYEAIEKFRAEDRSN